MAKQSSSITEAPGAFTKQFSINSLAWHEPQSYQLQHQQPQTPSPTLCHPWRLTLSISPDKHDLNQLSSSILRLVSVRTEILQEQGRQQFNKQ
jgi:hypothetical protein